MPFFLDLVSGEFEPDLLELVAIAANCDLGLGLAACNALCLDCALLAKDLPVISIGLGVQVVVTNVLASVAGLLELQEGAEEVGMQCLVRFHGVLLIFSLGIVIMDDEDEAADRVRGGCGKLDRVKTLLFTLTGGVLGWGMDLLIVSFCV